MYLYYWIFNDKRFPFQCWGNENLLFAIGFFCCQKLKAKSLKQVYPIGHRSQLLLKTEFPFLLKPDSPRQDKSVDVSERLRRFNDVYSLLFIFIAIFLTVGASTFERVNLEPQLHSF
jgi:hypothetical protein